MVQTDYIHVPYGKAVYGEAEIEAVNQVLRSSTQMGKHVRAMEERVARLYDKEYGIMVNSSAVFLSPAYAPRARGWRDGARDA